MTPDLAAVVFVAHLAFSPVHLAAATDSIPNVSPPAPGPLAPPAPSAEPESPVSPDATASATSRPGFDAAGDLVQAWTLRRMLATSDRQRIRVRGEFHEYHDLLAGPAGVHRARRERYGVSPAPRHTWSEIEKIEARGLVESPLKGAGEVAGYLGLITGVVAGGVAAVVTGGDESARGEAAGDAFIAGFGLTAVAGIVTEAVGDMALRPPGSWSTFYAPSASGDPTTEEAARRERIWETWLRMEGQRRIRITMTGSEPLELNEWAPAPGGIRTIRYHRRDYEPARDVSFAELECLEVLRAPGVGGPPPRQGRDVFGPLFVLGWVAGAAITADDLPEFGQNLVASSVVITVAALGIATLWMVPYHLFSHWEAVPIPK